MSLIKFSQEETLQTPRKSKEETPKKARKTLYVFVSYFQAHIDVHQQEKISFNVRQATTKVLEFVYLDNNKKSLCEAKVTRKKTRDSKRVLQEPSIIRESFSVETKETESSIIHRWKKKTAKISEKFFKCRRTKTLPVCNCLLSRHRIGEKENQNNNKMHKDFLCLRKKRMKRDGKEDRKTNMWEREMEMTLSHQLIRFYYDFSLDANLLFDASVCVFLGCWDVSRWNEMTHIRKWWRWVGFWDNFKGNF